VQTEAEGEAANARDESDEVTLEHAMAIAAPSSAMRACNLLPDSNLSQFSACLGLCWLIPCAAATREERKKKKP
jgi:hypothetical protein